MVPEEIVALFRPGAPMYIATRSPDLEPNGARVWGAVVEPDGQHLVAFVHERAAPSILQDLKSCPEVAITVGRVTDHATCQVKGIAVDWRPARDDERPEVERQTEGYRASVEAIGISRKATAPWNPWPSVAIRVRAREFFRQTPGPGAGEAIR